MKEIRIFSSSNKFTLVEEVNNFIKDDKYTICDIQFKTHGFIINEFSVMLVIEEK